MNMFKSNGGFTLVELIVVIAILAILAGAAIPAYSGYIARANDSTVLADLEAVETAAFAAAALKGETPIKIAIIGSANETAKEPVKDAKGNAYKNGTVLAYIADADGATSNEAGKEDTDAVYDVLDITEFFGTTVDLSKHSEYADGCTWYAEDGFNKETYDVTTKGADGKETTKTENVVKGWNPGYIANAAKA